MNWKAAFAVLSLLVVAASVEGRDVVRTSTRSNVIAASSCQCGVGCRCASVRASSKSVSSSTKCGAKCKTVSVSKSR